MPKSTSKGKRGTRAEGAQRTKQGDRKPAPGSGDPVQSQREPRTEAEDAALRGMGAVREGEPK